MSEHEKSDLERDPLGIDEVAAKRLVTSREWPVLEHRLLQVAHACQLAAGELLCTSAGAETDRAARDQAVRAAMLTDVVRSVRRSGGFSGEIGVEVKWVDNPETDDEEGDISE